MAPRRACDVLIVAADAGIAEASSAALVGAGHMVHLAPDADAGLACLLRTRYRLLVVDLEADGRGGYRLLRAVRAQPVLRPGAVLVIASLGQGSPVLAALEAGADDYIAQPVDPTDLALRSSVWLRRVGLAVPVAQPGLRIHSLGRFSVECQGKRLLHESGRARKANALFKLLLTHPEHKAPTGEVLDLLWPNTDEEVAATDLRSLLYQVRRLLGVSAHGRSYLEHSSTTLTLRLNAADWWDVHEFGTLLNEAAQWQRAGKFAQALRAYAAGIALYTGDYLQDDPYADWAAPTRERLRDDWLRALSAMATLYGEHNEHETQESVLRTILRADPYREPSYRTLMELLVSQGRSAEALVLYRRLAALLTAEFAACPDPETQALARRIAQRTL